MLKILLITNLFPLPWQPVRATFNYQQFSRLAERCDLRVLVLIPWLEKFRHDTGQGTIPEIKACVEYAGYFYIPGFCRVLYPLLMFPTLLVRAFRLRRNRPDCLVLSWAYPDAVAGVMLAHLLGIPAVIKIHGSDINMHARFPARASQIAWAMNKAETVISVSQDLAQKVVGLGVPEEKIRVIYNGVDKTMFYPVDREQVKKEKKLPQDRKILLYIGNLKPEKGCLDLLEAFRLLASPSTGATHSTDAENVDLYYIGDGSMFMKLQELASQFGLSERVKFLGPLMHEELPSWINASDAVVLPSYNEGVPNVLLESMSCGIPVVATTVGGIPEVVPDYAGLLVPAGDVHALSQALGRALDNVWDNRRICDAMAEFSWETNVLKLDELLQSASRSGQP